MAIYKTINTGSSGDEEKKLQQAQNTAAQAPDTENTGVGIAQDSGSGGSKNSSTGYTRFDYDPVADTAYQQALLQLQQAQKEMPTYQATYDQQLQDLYNQIVNRDKFSYSVNEDALYQQYRDQYVTQGQMAMMDTMGQAAGLTGGYGNSYAQNVGQQAYQGYLQRLNEVVPELYGMALDQYNQQGQALMNRYAMLGDMADTEYGRYQDQLNQYWQNLAYAQDRADTAYDRGYNNWYNAYQNAYQQERDQVADQQWQAAFDEDKRRYDQEWELALEKYRNSGSGGVEEEEPSYTGPGYAYQPVEHNMTEEQIRQLQMAAGLEVTGKWDADTEAAYMAVYGVEPGAQAPSPTDSSGDFAGWDAGMWEGYFARIRQTDGTAAAEEELNYFISKELIPKNMVSYAASGARGSSKGH